MSGKTIEEQKEHEKQKIVRKVRDLKLEGLLNDEDVKDIIDQLREGLGWLDEPS